MLSSGVQGSMLLANKNPLNDCLIHFLNFLSKAFWIERDRAAQRRAEQHSIVRSSIAHSHSRGWRTDMISDPASEGVGRWSIVRLKEEVGNYWCSGAVTTLWVGVDGRASAPIFLFHIFIFTAWFSSIGKYYRQTYTWGWYDNIQVDL